MTYFASRLYRNANDLSLMCELVRTVRPNTHLADYPSMSDLQEAMLIPAVKANTRLWLKNDASLLAFAFVDSYHNLHFEMLPHMVYSDIEPHIVAWGIECLKRTLNGEMHDVPTLDASCRSDDLTRRDFLRRFGFQELPLHSLTMARSLKDPIPESHLPSGFLIRPVQGEHEVEQLVALHRAAFGTNHMTIEERLSMMRVPDYDPNLDLVVVAADGRLAAYCFCIINLEENAATGRNEGYTDPIATHPDFQRQGLAQALILTGLRLLKERGVDTGVLGTSGENVAMQRAAEAVGFQIRSERLWFEQPLGD